jgi:hypothetical protein
MKGRDMIEESSPGTNDQMVLASVFHYVLGGFQIMLSSVGLVYIAMGIAMGTEAIAEDMTGGPPPEVMAWVFGAVGAIFTAVLLTMGLLVIRTGINLARRRNRTFCMVIDSVLCLMVPFGTIVGIFGLVLLMRPEYSRQFTG